MADTLIAAAPNELCSLARMSARLGADSLLVQASTGNTSVKMGQTMWVKASGKWLAHAEREQIFTCVELQDVRLRLENGQALAATSALRPSVETFMHAVIPYPVVAHVHAVNTIAAAIRADAYEYLRPRLAGLDWALIPHAESGPPLAKAISQAVAQNPATRIFVLANHGLVVCGEGYDEVENMVHHVELALRADPRPVMTDRLELLQQIQRLSNWEVPGHDVIHGLGTDPATRSIVKAGVLYPCQALFLGQPLPFVPCSETLAGPHLAKRSSPFLILEGCGVLVSDQITAAEYATLQGFAEVAARTDPGAPLRYLETGEIRQLLQAESSQAYKRSPANQLVYV